MAGEFAVANPHLMKELSERGLWTPSMKHRILSAGGSVQGIAEVPEDVRAIYRTAWEIKQRAIIDMAADRGAFIDQSQSLNLFVAEPNFAKLSSVEGGGCCALWVYASGMHFYAWKKGLKTGCYYLRTRPVVDAIKFTVDQ